MGLFRRNRIEHDAQDERKVAETELEANEASRGGVYLFFLVMFAVGFLVPFLLTFAFVSPLTIAASAAVGFVVATSVRIAPQWERVAVLRFGRFNRIAGPGIYCCIPFAEYAAIHVDQRIMTASFSAEAALTADLVPVDVDAILFWMVWDAEKACLEVENYIRRPCCARPRRPCATSSASSTLPTYPCDASRSTATSRRYWARSASSGA